MTYDVQTLNSLKKSWIVSTSNIPHRFMGLEAQDIINDLGSFPKEITNWLEKIYANKVIKRSGGLGTTGVGLLFDGGPGLGKTTHAVTTIMELIRNMPEKDEEVAELFKYTLSNLSRKSRPIYYMTFPEFISRKKALMEADPDVKQNLFQEMEGFHGRAKDDMLNVRVLVLDDLGKEYGSEYNNAAFDEVLRSRYDKGLPTIITTNVLRNDWERQYGAAMGSFAFEAFHRVAILGKDLRK
jgi:DNA replication protein DnaC